MLYNDLLVSDAYFRRELPTHGFNESPQERDRENNVAVKQHHRKNETEKRRPQRTPEQPPVSAREIKTSCGDVTCNALVGCSAAMNVTRLLQAQATHRGGCDTSFSRELPTSGCLYFRNRDKKLRSQRKQEQPKEHLRFIQNVSHIMQYNSLCVDSKLTASSGVHARKKNLLRGRATIF